MVVGMVVFVDGVIRALVDCCNDCIAAQITVILIAGVPQVAMEEEYISGLHLH